MNTTKFLVGAVAAAALACGEPLTYPKHHFRCVVGFVRYLAVRNRGIANRRM